MSLRLKREATINKILETLKEIKKNNLSLDEDSLIFEICIENNCTRRTAYEYFRTAQFLLKNGK